VDPETGEDRWKKQPPILPRMDGKKGDVPMSVEKCEAGIVGL
jgi:hypothetical protein